MSCERNFKYIHKQRLTSSINRFLTKRRKTMDLICEVLAKLIVNPENIEDEFYEEHLMNLTTKYVKYSCILYRVEKSLDLTVNVEDNLHKLLGCIQEERAKLKHINKFINQAKSYLPFLDEVYNRAAGDDCETEKSRVGIDANDVIVEICDDDEDTETIVLNGMICAC